MGAGLFLPASKIAKGASLGQKALAGAKTAGLYGAASGAMSSKDETLLGRASDALSAGGVASLAGAAFPYVTKAASIAARPLRPFTDPVVRLAGRGLQTVGDYLPGAVGRSVAAEGAHLARDPALAAANAQLGREIGNTLHPQTRQPMRPQQVAEEVGKRQAVGVPAVAADLGDNLRSRFSKAVRTPGPALSSVRRHIEARQQQEAERAARHIAETLGPVGNIEQQAATLNAEAR
ncbi:MAG TPA: hypothetical protein VMR39_08535, partial [Sphingobium sp.]|nr:hypothetical protein [Sphingobium sp.]